MQTQKHVKPSLNTHTILSCIAAIIILVLIILVCIFAGRATHIQHEYAAIQQTFSEALYSDLYMFVRSYDGVTLAGANVEGAILPTMEKYYLSAKTLDETIVEAYGQRYSVLQGGTDTAIAAAFQAFDDAFRLGRNTSDAVSSMSSCMQSIETILTTRFDANNRLLPI